MRLLTHNVLRSPIKGAVEGYPLKIEATDVQVSPMWIPMVQYSEE